MSIAGPKVGITKNRFLKLVLNLLSKSKLAALKLKVCEAPKYDVSVNAYNNRSRTQ